MRDLARRIMLVLVAALLLAGEAMPSLSAAAVDDDGAATDSAPANEGGDAESAPAGAEPPPLPQSGRAPLPAGADIAVIPIRGLIYDFTLQSLQRRVDRAIAAGAAVIVIELDTPGGVATSALDICKYIKGRIRRPDGTTVPTVAWINDKAYSAGILIASACDRIVMSPASSTGDCAPIVPGMDLQPTERAKALSPILSEFEDNAAKGHDYVLFHAMCVLHVEVYKVKHRDTGKEKLVNQIDYAIMVQGEEPGSGVLDTIAQKLGFAGGTDEVGAPSRMVATDADRGQWTLVEQVHNGSTLLTLSQRQATAVGLAEAGNIRDVDDLQAHFAAKSVVVVDETWSETVAGWMTMLPVRAALVIIMLIALAIEMHAPGIGLPGLIALIAFIGLIAPPFVVGLAEIWHLILLFVGFVLLMVEVFVTPGFGVMGVSGIVCMVAGLVLAVVPTSGGGPVPLPAPEMVTRLQQSVMWMMVALLLTGVGFFVLFRHYGRVPLLGRMMLTDREPARMFGSVSAGGGEVGAGEAGAAAATPHISGDDAIGGGAIAAGAVGHAIMDLRPIGRAEIAGRVIDVETEGGWIPRGRPIRVVRRVGNRIIVEGA